MGLGGHLMWTAVAAAIKKEKNVPVLPIDDSRTVINSEIFINNSNFTTNKNNDHFCINLSNPALIYLEEHGSRVRFKTNEHVITFCCKQLGIKNYKLKCELFLTEAEETQAQKVVQTLPTKYICIEPYSKMSWSQGKVYPFTKWQNIINTLKDKVSFVQVGSGGQPALENVIDLSGKLSFRECSYVLKKSSLLLASEGGIVHLANAANTKSVVIFTSFHSHPSVFHYPDNIIVDISLYRDEIGGYKNHPLLKQERDIHNENEIIHFINENIYSF